VDAVSAGIEMGEEVPKGYITAKQEKAEAARKLGFSVYSRFKSKERPKGKALSMIHIEQSFREEEREL